MCHLLYSFVLCFSPSPYLCNFWHLLFNNSIAHGIHFLWDKARTHARTHFSVLSSSSFLFVFWLSIIPIFFLLSGFLVILREKNCHFQMVVIYIMMLCFLPANRHQREFRYHIYFYFIFIETIFYNEKKTDNKLSFYLSLGCSSNSLLRRTETLGTASLAKARHTLEQNLVNMATVVPSMQQHSLQTLFTILYLRCIFV